ncbi:hypothetical protein CAPTEDRAFT_194057 [Capitella teleta]|uniref:Protein S-acyltransferase n=1 Tax=Capitella teleta TaxID=283909 RepID=R7UXA4_CAPTE|nr:hypothetical protein CAPTEDRAFT_194057 [Capitella teleta]|eukprot:ELU10979.1 hypothetical protein CAPTEDRAFT_194057 [Capitella teleta]
MGATHPPDQESTAPPTPDVVYESTSRRNGWSWPPHPFQFIAWGIFLYFAVFYFSTSVPGCLNEWQPPAYVVVAVLFVLHVVLHVLAVSVNPADSAVLFKMASAYASVPAEAWLSFTALTGLLAVVAVALLLHLLGFHFYLISKGLSTYDYIVKEREECERKARMQEEQLISQPDLNIKSKNRVVPQQTDGYELETELTARSSRASFCEFSSPLGMLFLFI